ncbi:hypothetical protein NTGM5_150086 [Candidatus Nitrotoga sp. M5]|nr:hypothetical protein NTGM5_150086 [Candidatus Nitrotoga sp. M5]
MLIQCTEAVLQQGDDKEFALALTVVFLHGMAKLHCFHQKIYAFLKKQ